MTDLYRANDGKIILPLSRRTVIAGGLSFLLMPHKEAHARQDFEQSTIRLKRHLARELRIHPKAIVAKNPNTPKPYQKRVDNHKRWVRSDEQTSTHTVRVALAQTPARITANLSSGSSARSPYRLQDDPYFNAKDMMAFAQKRLADLDTKFQYQGGSARNVGLIVDPDGSFHTEGAPVLNAGILAADCLAGRGLMRYSMQMLDFAKSHLDDPSSAAEFQETLIKLGRDTGTQIHNLGFIDLRATQTNNVIVFNGQLLDAEAACGLYIAPDYHTIGIKNAVDPDDAWVLSFATGIAQVVVLEVDFIARWLTLNGVRVPLSQPERNKSYFGNGVSSTGA